MSEADQVEQERKALEALVVNNPDLERLEALLGRFNIFEAVGLVRQEIRHSAFLAFLLDPQENHGLGDAFVKRLLQEAIMSAPETTVPVTPIELSLWDLEQMEVRREWQHIDIFLVDERNRLAVIIENKIDTGEHSDQLKRYHEVVKQHYSGYKTIGLYLTPAGDKPSHEAYLPLGYGLVCEVLDSLAKSQASVSNPDLQILVAHYTQMLRRYIVGDSEIARLSRQIYQKHQQAIDLIFQHRFAHMEALRSVLLGLVREHPMLVHEGRWADYPKHEFINFGVQEWYTRALRVAEGWTRSNLILAFCLANWPNSVGLMLQVGPGDEEARQKLLNMARRDPDLFESEPSVWGEGKWINIYTKPLLAPASYDDLTDSERGREIRKQWNGFIDNDLPRIDAALRRESWIWQDSSGSDDAV